MRVAAGLESAGVLVGAIRPPSVPAGSARLRITFSSAHEETDVDRLLETLAKVVGPRDQAPESAARL
jgi:8-amino-7-oxononanoate synthase